MEKRAIETSYVYGTKIRVKKEYKRVLRDLAAVMQGTTESAFRDAIERRLNALGIKNSTFAPEEQLDVLCHRTGRTQMAEAHFCIDSLAQSLGVQPEREVEGEIWA